MSVRSTSTTPRVVRTLLVIAACAASVGGCADEEDQDPGTTSPLITLKYEEDSWPAAEVAGKLTERKGCLLIGSSVAVFPFGTDWTEPNVVFVDGTKATVGTQVSLGGGSFDVDAVAQDELPIVPLAKVQACAQSTGVDNFVWAMP